MFEMVVSMVYRKDGRKRKEDDEGSDEEIVVEHKILTKDGIGAFLYSLCFEDLRRCAIKRISPVEFEVMYEIRRKKMKGGEKVR